MFTWVQMLITVVIGKVNPEIENIIELIVSKLQGKLTQAQASELEQWRSERVQHAEELAALSSAAITAQRLQRWQSYDPQNIAARLAKEFPSLSISQLCETPFAQLPRTSGLHPTRLLTTPFFRYAAAIIIVLIGLSVYFLFPKKQNADVSKASLSSVVNDVQPGSRKAVLTLADGQQVTLDHTADALLNSRGIINHHDLISYSGKAVPDAINILSTPKGGQYQLRLPDGTMVWLNAASSITYPTRFAGANRKVSLTGEAYFEVPKNKEKPFIVQAGGQQIEVLGTSFNVNAYSNEPVLKTSLLAGSVKIDNIILKPGQAYVNGQVRSTDVQQDVAWKNGAFNFSNTDLVNAMRQIERWYDVQVVFEGKIPVLKLKGELPMEFTLQQTLAAFADYGLKFKLEGKQLIISP